MNECSRFLHAQARQYTSKPALKTKLTAISFLGDLPRDIVPATSTPMEQSHGQSKPVMKRMEVRQNIHSPRQAGQPS